MKYMLYFSILLLAFAECKSPDHESSVSKPETVDFEGYAMVIHGGAGTILKENMTKMKEEAYKLALNKALTIGSQVLEEGGSSIDAVEQVIRHMEDNPLFNAGRGAVFNHDGGHELDASIMTGQDQKAGAVGGVTNIRHPISAARAVLEKSKHVMMVGPGAEKFSLSHGLEEVDNSFFHTDHRMYRHQQQKIKSQGTGHVEPILDDKYGTVGCVALDKAGNICAGTSTGGMTNKQFNRIGDSPIIGAGTYADNAQCGISCTGHGEYFIRYAVAHDIAARMEYKGLDLETASQETIMQKLKSKGGSGGVVGLDANGNISMVFNTPGMYRGYVKNGTSVIGIYEEIFDEQ